MRRPDPDTAFAALVESLRVGGEDGLLEIRRSGDEAVLVFRWPGERHVVGLPVDLTDAARRRDWSEARAGDLTEWVESIEIWLMEARDTGMAYGARRRLVDDYLELRDRPGWPNDERFYPSVVLAGDERSWPRVRSVARDGLDTGPAERHRADGSLVAWVTTYENNATGSPYVGQAVVARTGAGGGDVEIVWLETLRGVPRTVELELVRLGAYVAAEQTGAQRVVTSLPIGCLDIAGFRPTTDGRLAVDTLFLDGDPDAAVRLHDAELAAPGPWGRDRDRAGRYLPTTRWGRLLHRVRHGGSGVRARTYVG